LGRPDKVVVKKVVTKTTHIERNSFSSSDEDGEACKIALGKIVGDDQMTQQQQRIARQKQNAAEKLLKKEQHVVNMKGKADKLVETTRLKAERQHMRIAKNKIKQEEKQNKMIRKKLQATERRIQLGAESEESDISSHNTDSDDNKSDSENG
jgi:CRISPR/Cas system CMR-associated protein Cmr3 (group 5 of RAMP superfamily)